MAMAEVATTENHIKLEIEKKETTVAEEEETGSITREARTKREIKSTSKKEARESSKKVKLKANNLKGKSNTLPRHRSPNLTPLSKRASHKPRKRMKNNLETLTLLPEPRWRRSRLD